MADTATFSTETAEATYLRSLATLACLYAWPLYEMQRMRAATALRQAPGLGFAGDTRDSTLRWANLIRAERHLLTAAATQVVMPNTDTLYLGAWLTLEDGPLVLHLPRTEGRYHVLGLLDYYTNPFGHLGTRTLGNDGAAVLLTPPGWDGDVPAAFQAPGRHLPAPTPWVWMIGRILVDGPDDVATVNALQDSFRLQRLADWRAGRDDTAPPQRFDAGPLPATPLTPASFVACVNDALRRNPAPAADAALLAQFVEIGIGAEATPPSAAALLALEQALATVKALLDTPSADSATAPGWQQALQLGESFGHDFRLRAFVARQAIGALAADEAVYPRCLTDDQGQPLHGSQRYQLRFAPGQLPPVDAFWSITLYDSTRNLLVPNALNRYAIGDRTAGLAWDTDGGLTLHLQHTAPDTPEARRNWLPTPADGFFLCLRAYLPHAALRDGQHPLPLPAQLPTRLPA